MTKTKTLTPTLALILAGGLAAGIALARPSAPTPTPSAAPAVEANPRAPGYRTGERDRGAAAPRAEAAAAAGAATVVISNFDFGGTTTVGAGQPVTVTNADSVAHTLTLTSGELDTGSIDGAAAVQFTAPTAPGTYDFFCTIHPSMQGQLVVQGQ